MDSKWTSFGSLLPWLLLSASLAGLGFSLFAGCGVSRSELIKDASIPIICKIGLEGMYMCQDNKDCVGAVVSQTVPSCKKWLVKTACADKYPIAIDMTELQKLRLEKEIKNCELNLN